MKRRTITSFILGRIITGNKNKNFASKTDNCRKKKSKFVFTNT